MANDLPIFSPAMTRHILSRSRKRLTKGERPGVQPGPASIRDDPIFVADAERLRKALKQSPFGVTTRRETL